MNEQPTYYRPAPSTERPALQADVCIYGANAAGVIAAIQARRLGLSVALVNPAWHLGGLTSGGLGFTDFGNKGIIGGLAREFYRRVGAHYGKAEEWCFEPHVAERVFTAWLREMEIATENGYYIHIAHKRGDRIAEIASTSGLRIQASYYIDCSYEGDLMGAAKVTHAVGREGIETYGESYNGQQIHASHQFNNPVDPYVRAGDPRSGLLPGIDPDPVFIPGFGDRRIQAYNFRVCMTKRPEVRIPFAKPSDYNRTWYELLARHFAAGGMETFAKFDRTQNGKTDTNNHGAFSTDFIGQNWAWPEGDFEEREKIFQAHVNYQRGYHWFMANDSAVPEAIRTQYQQWGLAADEFQDSDHWPRQLYVREARRLVGQAVMTEKHCLARADVDDPIGLGAYTMDSHNCRRLVHNGIVLNEGNVEIKLPRPYGISYRAIVPKREDCANLLVPVCLSASHIAYGSIRMEPVFMILAQSAATAASVALRAQCTVSEVPYSDIRAQAMRDGQIISWNPSIAHNPAAVNEREMAADSSEV